MRKKRFLILSLCLGLGITMVGCNNNSKEGNIQQGFAAIESLEYEQALNCFEQAKDANENLQQIARGEGIALLGLTRYEEAVEKFTQSLSYSDEWVDDFDFDTNYYLATAYFKMGKYEEAGAVYSAILDLKENKEAHFLQGVVYLKQGNLSAAKNHFNEAVKEDKTDYDLCVNIYQALAEEGYEEEGKAYIQASLGNSDKKMSDYQKGRLSYYMGDYEGARNFLEATKSNKDAETVLLLGQTYEKLGDFNYAASIYSNYLADHSDNVVICNRLGMCKLQAGDAQTALDYFNQALALEDSGMTQILKFNQIVAYEYLGDFAQANVLMKNYLKVYPDDEDAKREYEFLQSR